MCAIFGSYDIDTFIYLRDANSYRGSHSYSISYYDGNRIAVVDKGLGEMPERKLEKGMFYIGHVQAPTTDGKDIDSVHPAKDKGDLLWHNGIIKDHQIKNWQSQWKKDWAWDTKWLLYLLNSGDPVKTLSEADGSFACLWYGKYNPYLYLFRNDNCPMFIDGHDFSSTKFVGAQSIMSGQFYFFDSKQGWLPHYNRFETKDTFYWSAV